MSNEKQLTRQIGEHLAVAELGRRGIIATPFAGNVAKYDILACKNDIAITIQVKAIRIGQSPVNLRNFVVVEDFTEVEVDGKPKTQQSISKKVDDPDKNLIYIYVFIADPVSTDENKKLDRFYIIRKIELNEIVFRNYSAYLAGCSPPGVRPKNSESLDARIYEKDIQKFRNNWAIVDDCFQPKILGLEP